MTPRSRTKKHKDLANIDNLYRQTKNGVDYFLYRNPSNGKTISLGKNKNNAIRKALDLNEHFMKDQNLITLLSDSYGFPELVKRYKKEMLPDRKLAKSTYELVIARLDRIGDDLAGRDTKTFTVEDCAVYLNSNYENNGYIKHRSELKQLFKFAMNIGWADSNPADLTYAQPEPDKVTHRMKLEEFIAIYQLAPNFIRVAMLMSLTLLQGRSETLRAKYAHVDGDCIKFRRQKNQRFEHSNISITSPIVPEIIKLSRQDSLASPFIVHRKPLRIVKRKNAEHWTQVMPNRFTEIFREVRGRTGLFDKLTEDERPGQHEIRALGSYLFKKQKVDLTSVQKVMAHAKPETTEDIYQSGHDNEIEYVDAPIPALDLVGLGIKI